MNPPKRGPGRPKKDASEKAPDLKDLLLRVSDDAFMTMLRHSGLSTQEVRDLADAFREAKEK